MRQTKQPAPMGPVERMVGPGAEARPLVERLRQRAHNGIAPMHELARLDMLAAADEIERLHQLLKVPTRGMVFAGWFSELRSGMSYRLWEQGGHDPEPDEVPLYV